MGLKIDLEKSELNLMSEGVVVNVKDLTRVLGCKVSTLPTICLELPLGALFKSTWWRKDLKNTCYLEEVVLIKR